MNGPSVQISAIPRIPPPPWIWQRTPYRSSVFHFKRRHHQARGFGSKTGVYQRTSHCCPDKNALRRSGFDQDHVSQELKRIKHRAIIGFQIAAGPCWRNIVQDRDKRGPANEAGVKFPSILFFHQPAEKADDPGSATLPSGLLPGRQPRFVYRDNKSLHSMIVYRITKSGTKIRDSDPI